MGSNRHAQERGGAAPGPRRLGDGGLLVRRLGRAKVLELFTETINAPGGASTCPRPGGLPNYL